MLEAGFTDGDLPAQRASEARIVGGLGVDPPDQVVVAAVDLGIVRHKLGFADAAEPGQRLGDHPGTGPGTGCAPMAFLTGAVTAVIPAIVTGVVVGEERIFESGQGVLAADEASGRPSR
ncbi:hypothetical protein [Nonomuraea dietziae]|uniref:hypothetical protein n=1 Tax=Nonomuraea dietziae TaxID=65515 RepID=UPI0033C5BF8B